MFDSNNYYQILYVEEMRKRSRDLAKRIQERENIKVGIRQTNKFGSNFRVNYGGEIRYFTSIGGVFKFLYDKIYI